MSSTPQAIPKSIESVWTNDHEHLLDSLFNIQTGTFGTPEAIRELLLDINRRLHANGMPPLDLNVLSQRESLGTAAAFGSIDLLRVMMEFGLDPRAPQGNNRSRNGSLLHNKTIGTPISDLLDLGLDPNSRDEDQQTPLHYHAGYLCTESIRELIRRGADPNAVDSRGMTPLMAATSCWEDGAAPEALKALVNGGADLEIKRRDGMTALHFAASCPSNCAVLTLVQCGAQLNSEDYQGLRPLHHAAMKDRNSIHTLVALGADRWGVYSTKTIAHERIHEPRLVSAARTFSLDIFAEHLKRFPHPSDEDVKSAQKILAKKEPEFLAILSAHLAKQQIEAIRVGGPRSAP